MQPDGSIENIILSNDKRDIAQFSRYLPSAFCEDAARFLLTHPQNAIITTGFLIPMSLKPETDGPPSAIALGDALSALGWEVTYVTDHYTVPLLKPFTNKNSIINFPITDLFTSKDFSKQLLKRINPSILISIERCGINEFGLYANMTGIDITSHTARVDTLFSESIPSIGVGDGGNEIGMGNIPVSNETKQLKIDFSITSTSKLIISSVSNWGCYGLIAALSIQIQKNLLPSIDSQKCLIQGMVALGAVDGTTGQSTTTVDSFCLKENLSILQALHHFVEENLTEQK